MIESVALAVVKASLFFIGKRQIRGLKNTEFFNQSFDILLHGTVDEHKLRIDIEKETLFNIIPPCDCKKTAPPPRKGSMYRRMGPEPWPVGSRGTSVSRSCVFPPAHFRNGRADRELICHRLFFVRRDTEEKPEVSLGSPEDLSRHLHRPDGGELLPGQELDARPTAG